MKKIDKISIIAVIFIIAMIIYAFGFDHMSRSLAHKIVQDDIYLQYITCTVDSHDEVLLEVNREYLGNHPKTLQALEVLETTEDNIIVIIYEDYY